MSALVKLADVSKRYAGAQALHSTNLSIERGKTTLLIGPSGCGKSTLLLLMIGLIAPDSGTIAFNDLTITDWLRYPGRRSVSASDRARQCSLDGPLSWEIPGGNAKQAHGIVRADEIF